MFQQCTEEAWPRNAADENQSPTSPTLREPPLSPSSEISIPRGDSSSTDSVWVLRNQDRTGQDSATLPSATPAKSHVSETARQCRSRRELPSSDQEKPTGLRSQRANIGETITRQSPWSGFTVNRNHGDKPVFCLKHEAATLLSLPSAERRHANVTTRRGSSPSHPDPV